MYLLICRLLDVEIQRIVLIGSRFSSVTLSICLLLLNYGLPCPVVAPRIACFLTSCSELLRVVLSCCGPLCCRYMGVMSHTSALLFPTAAYLSVFLSILSMCIVV